MRIPSVSNSDDIIDSRDVIARIAELEVSRDAAIEAINDPETPNWTSEDGTEYGETPDWTQEEASELAVLTALADEANGYAADWQYGETLIRESYFQTYAQDLAEDLGYIKHDTNWPYNHIDWEAAANELKTDYTTVDFDGTDYLIRS